MKLVCNADERAWVEVQDFWSRKMYNEYIQNLTDEDYVNEFFKRIVKGCCLVDFEGNEHKGVEACLAIDFDEIEFDIAIENFWTTVPLQAYQERSRLGNAKRVS